MSPPHGFCNGAGERPEPASPVGERGATGQDLHGGGHGGAGDVQHGARRWRPWCDHRPERRRPEDSSRSQAEEDEEEGAAGRRWRRPDADPGAGPDADADLGADADPDPGADADPGAGAEVQTDAESLATLVLKGDLVLRNAEYSSAVNSIGESVMSEVLNQATQAAGNPSLLKTWKDVKLQSKEGTDTAITHTKPLAIIRNNSCFYKNY